MSTAQPTVAINRRGVDRLQRGHLWVYRSDVQLVDEPEPGDLVRLVDGRGRFRGQAFYSSTSQITLRLFATDESAIADDTIKQRIGQAIAARARLFGPDGPQALRLVHAEADLLPGLVVDRYGPVLVIQTSIQATDRRLDRIVEALVELTGVETVIERNDGKTRRYEDLEPRVGVLRGHLDGPVELIDGSIRRWVDPLRGQKTGGFLDQRLNQQRAAGLVRPGDRCLDVFSYSGGFALPMAAAGGRVTAIDVSAEALGEGARAAEASGLEVEWVEENAFDWLKAASEQGELAEVVVLDPPAFAPSKRALESAVRGYKEINLRALKLLHRQGFLVTCSCSHNLAEERFLELIEAAAADARRRVQLIERRGAGPDHPVLVGVPETSYLKCLILRVIE